MAACFCCLRCCWHGTGFSTGHVPLKELPDVKLDTNHLGNDVVIVKNGRRICGTGGALATAPIVQNKAFFEIKLQSSGVWGLGLATRRVDLHTVPMGTTAESWVLNDAGILLHNNEEKGKLAELPQEGDIIGVTFDHIEMNFYLNGKALGTPFCGIKGTVYPIVYVDEGAIIDVQFCGFYHPPPEGFERIMIEQSLL